MTYTGPAWQHPQHSPLPEPAPQHAYAVAQADQRAAHLTSGTATVLQGLLTLGLLEHVNGPQKLLEAVLPDLPPSLERDAAMFLAGAIAGTAAGQRRARARWAPTGSDLAAAVTALQDAGWHAMAAACHRAIDTTTAHPHQAHRRGPHTPGPWDGGAQ